jgi:RimJ/RimL family protein N-acetyltransferase
MILERGNVKLVRLTEEHIELVRNWRNSAAIRNTMEYREEISPDMQRTWFRKIDNVNNNYFLIETSGKFIGLIYGADIDWENGITNNGGIFIGDTEYLESVEIMEAALMLTDIGFMMGMKVNYIKILSDNTRSIAFNRSMGYKLLPGQDDVYNQRYELREPEYQQATEKIRQHFGFRKELRVYLTHSEHSIREALAARVHAARAAGKNVYLEIIEI